MQIIKGCKTILGIVMAVGQLIMVECKLEQKYDLIMAGNKNVTSDSPKAIKTDRICWPTL